MAIHLQEENGTLVAILSGEIDHHIAGPMRLEIDEKIEQQQPHTLILDFAEVTFMDSSGIGLIIGRHRAMKEIGGILIVQNPPAHIHKVMRISGIHRIAQIQTTERREVE